ncbi:HIT domain-containing protein [Parahaliea maris]|uniref:HIT domain-containing protein n=1 Tax=Parahaliea maris TaxID=2716870 RepID=A0A5C8ZNY6_9GAMM|nr:HIT domain-containing protein [Parahaliea maris]TXS90226.1 HIT domain-containing protein [Parahaliea maris]
MNNPAHSLHPRLLADSHLLGHLDGGTLLLSRNALLHWFILVPETELEDVLDLPAAQLPIVLADCRALSVFLKEELHYPKVNFAGLGNVVPQMHLHIVGRREGDACWPQPVWGNLPAGRPWQDDELVALKEGLAAHCGLVKS